MLEHRTFPYSPSLTERHGVQILQRHFAEGDYGVCLRAAALMMEVDPHSAAVTNYFLQAAERLEYGFEVRALLEELSQGLAWFEEPLAYQTVRQHFKNRAH